MKKIVILLSIIILLSSGCSIRELDNKNYEKNIDMLLSEKTKVTNVNFEGYKYYVPQGLIFINKDDYNAVLKDDFNNTYYLYVDVVSYYHKTRKVYKINNKASYSKVLDYNDKDGYIEISEKGSKYFVKFIFNYVKIEAYINKDSLVPAINNMCYLLRSFKFNDKVLESIVGNNILSYTEESFSLFDDKDSNDDVLEVDDGFDQNYNENKYHDELKFDEE